MKPPVLYLASQSPRRLALLEQIGITPTLLLPDADEDAEALEQVQVKEKPAQYVQRVALLKWQAALERLQRRAWPHAPILCSDTTVACAGRILGKPDSPQSAIAMLKQLSGHRHQVLTAVVVGTATQAPKLALSRSWVHFRVLKDQEIKNYVKSGEPMGKAGAYAIQGSAQRWVTEIRGSYSGIMGLPLFETDQLLQFFRIKG